MVWAIAILLQSLASSASACVCGSEFAGVFLLSDGLQRPVASDGLVRLYEFPAGASSESEWGLYDADGLPVEFSELSFPEFGGGAMVEWKPVEPLFPGTYRVRGRDWPSESGFEFTVVEHAESRDPPVLSTASWSSPTVLRDTSCGQVHRHVALDLDAVNAEGAYVRILDHSTGLYWHSSSLSWNATCGGVPTQYWSGRKEVWLTDEAGQRSNTVSVGGAPTGGCETGGLGVGDPILLAWMLVHCFRYRQRRIVGYRGSCS